MRSLQTRLERLEAKAPRPQPHVVSLIDDGDADIDADMARCRREIGPDVEFIVFTIVDPPVRGKLQ